MSDLVILADAAVTAWILYLFLRPWLHARRLGIAISVPWVLNQRIGGGPPILLIDAFVAQRRLGDELPMRIIEAAWQANRKNISNARDLARFAREMRDRLAAA